MIKNKSVKTRRNDLLIFAVILVFIYTIFRFNITWIHGVILIGIVIYLGINRYDIIPYLGVHRRRVSTKQETQIAADERWFDDYYTIRYIDKNTIAIGEPRYWQRNYNYLIIGEEKAVLFDSGPGVRDITKVVKALTNLPVINMVSHYHYDHVGNIDKFNEIYLGEIQLTGQEKIDGNTIIPNKKSFLGNIEGLKAKKIKFSRVLKNTESIDLGNRKLKILNVQGHAYESIALYDEKSKQLFAGDYLMKGPIIANKMVMPSASLIDYKWSIKNVLDNIEVGTNVYVAHPVDFESQTLGYDDIVGLNNFFSKVEKNKIIPKKVKINENLNVIY